MKGSAAKTTAVLLCGGTSERLGFPKEMLRVDGAPLAVHMVRRLKPLFDEVLVSSNNPGYLRHHLDVPILVGIVLLRSAGMARFMNKNVAGVHVPDNLIDEMEKAEKRMQKSVEIAARLIKDMKSMCQGVHIMAIGMEKRVPEIIEAAGL